MSTAKPKVSAPIQALVDAVRGVLTPKQQEEFRVAWDGEQKPERKPMQISDEMLEQARQPMRPYRKPACCF